jgi:predicted DNA binding CopG/RHH family protein
MPKRSVRKAVPAFANERKEREFWETHDASPFVDWEKARIAVFPDLRPSTETISLRLPTALLSELKALASKRDVPYQSLLKVFLAERVASEIGRIDAPPNTYQASDRQEDKRVRSGGQRRSRARTARRSGP